MAATPDQLKEAFGLYDTTGTNVLKWPDFKDAIRSLGTPVTEAQFNRVRAAAGSEVTLDDFQKLYSQVMAGAPASNGEADLDDAFKAMDSNGSGKVSKKMVRYFFLNVGDLLTEEEADAMLANAPDEMDAAAFKKCIQGA